LQPIEISAHKQHASLMILHHFVTEKPVRCSDQKKDFDK
jgi:hypothetical protein